VSSAGLLISTILEDSINKVLLHEISMCIIFKELTTGDPKEIWNTNCNTLTEISEILCIHVLRSVRYDMVYSPISHRKGLSL
jgi:hypothetical protein